MVTKISKAISGGFVVFFSLSGFAQSASVNGSYHWWRGKEKIPLELVSDHVVDFAPSESQNPASQSLKPLSIKKLRGGVQVLKYTKADFSKAMMAKSVANQRTSPLFRQGGELIAFSGGVVVTFRAGVTESKVREFCAQQGLVLKRKYTLTEEQQIWVVDSPAGLESLNLANELSENQSNLIEVARPSFWQPLDTRELKSVR
jgi:hypothetical protein